MGERHGGTQARRGGRRQKGVRGKESYLMAASKRHHRHVALTRSTRPRGGVDESERLLRIATVFEKAVDLFEGDLVSARRWLSTPKKALGGETPLSFARTEIGGREVEALIGRLEHGVFS